MDTNSLIIAPVLVALGALFVALGPLLVRSSYPPGARAAGLAMLAVSVWLFGAAGEVLTVDSPALYPFVRAFKYVGVATVGPIFLVFVLRYALGLRPSAGFLAALMVVPAATIALVWTNPLHELMWEHPFPPLGRGEWGPWFTRVHTPYSYLTILAGTAGLVLEMIRGSTIRRAQSSVLLVGALVPLTVNAIYLANPELPDLSQTPLSFGVTALIFGWGFFRLQLFQVSALALRAAFQAVDDAVIVVDRERRIAELNPASRRLLDPHGAGESLGLPVEPALDAAGLDGITLEDRARADVVSPEGRRYETDVRMIRDRRKGDGRGWIIVLRDVTDQRLAEDALRQSEAMMRSVLDRSPIGILRLTPLRDHTGRIRDFSIVLANPTAHDILVRIDETLVGRTLSEIRPPHTPVILDTLRRVLRTGKPEEAVVSDERDGRDPAWLRANAVPVGRDVTLTFVDITGERTARLEMATKAHTDPLTGLLNRRGLEKDAHQLIASARADRRPLALLYLDLDDFKQVNDQHGHDIGDAVLREFARRVRSSLRGEDVLARVGGDEFVVLLQDPGTETVAMVTQRIRVACRTALAVDPRRPPEEAGIILGCSIGSARLPDDGLAYPDLVRVADEAMYAVKQRHTAAGE